MKLLERHYWLGFNLCPGIGPVRFYHLLKVFGSAKKAWLSSQDSLFKTKIPHKIIEKLIHYRQKVNLASEIVWLEKKLIKFLIIEDKNYPKNLEMIPNPPPLIYMMGRILGQDDNAIAVVGTRNITAYGREVTERLVTDLINAGFTIVSGLARGVDSLAHRLALGNNSRTIAVLGSGLDHIYPPEHKALAEKIISLDLGAVISQLPPSMGPLKGHFPSRNRLISGLSLGVLVTEGANKSGAKIAAEYARVHNRPVFAVPGPITSALSEGPADLIKTGARLVTKAGDIIRELKVDKVDKVERSRERKILKFNNNDEEKVWELLTSGGKHIDEIIRTSGFSSTKILSCLTTMELKGMVKNIGGGNYIII